MAQYHNLVALLCFALLITKSQSAPAYGNNICDFCEEFVGAFDDQIQGGVANVEQQVSLACDVVHPQWLQERCPKYVDRYLDDIIMGLNQKLSPKEICYNIPICR